MHAARMYRAYKPMLSLNACFVQCYIRFNWHYGCHKLEGKKEKGSRSPAASLGRVLVAGTETAAGKLDSVLPKSRSNGERVRVPSKRALAGSALSNPALPPPARRSQPVTPLRNFIGEFAPTQPFFSFALRRP